MYLKDLIAFLKKHNPKTVVPRGFCNPHSYRGYYQELAFEPTENVTVGAMLKDARKAKGATFTGYKGGEFTMGDYTTCYLANYSQTGDELSEQMLKYMFGEVENCAKCVMTELERSKEAEVFDWIESACKAHASGKISLEEALKRVSEAVAIRRKILGLRGNAGKKPARGGRKN